ncbi:ArsR/SmtB family transcription factor [Mycetocola spongiae]|uniref:ArsR/SmtB family transcription factor n=1 Tax=Mycetocola spongiae TaxID=2859226 RepID=UPI00384FEA2F|nr:metalloregulator ArsR/SmtB family transcription factor [Mycetocola spongiae]
MTTTEVSAGCAGGIGPETLGPEEAITLAKSLRALADPARLRLLSIIAGSPAGEVCVCDLTEPLGLGQPTVSHHLKILVEAGFLGRERRGTWAYYSPIPGALERAGAALAQLPARSAAAVY